MAPVADLVVGLVDDGDHRPRINAGHFVSETTPRWQTLAARTGSTPAKNIEIDGLEGGRESGDTSVVADTHGNLDLYRRRVPPADRG